MRCFLTILITLAVAVGCAYGSLRLFSRLAGVDAFDVLSWHADRKQLPILLVITFLYFSR